MSFVQPAFDAIERLITEFSLRRLLVLLLVFIGVSGSVVFAERYTNYFKLGRLERTVGLIERMEQLSSRPGVQEGQPLQGHREFKLDSC